MLAILFSTLFAACTVEAASFQAYDAFGSAKSYSDQVILNPPSPASQLGAIWGKSKNELKEWSLEIMYRVNGPMHGGKGMAIWYTAERGQGGPIYGSADKWDGLGLFLTAEPDGTGTLRGHLNDRTTTFAKLDSPEKHAFGSCTFPYRNLGTISSIRVSYNPSSLKVVHDGQLCFENYHISLPTDHYFGVSAQSGELPDSHELFSFELKSESHTPGSVNRATQQQEQAQAKAASHASTHKTDSNPSALDSAMQRVITKLIADSDKMSLRIEEISQMKSVIDRIESSIGRLDHSISNVQHGRLGSDGSSKEAYEKLVHQIRAMEDKFNQMERHIEKQTDHIVQSLPPVAGPLKNAVYVLILVQVFICGAYIMYRRKTEEKSKFL